MLFEFFHTAGQSDLFLSIFCSIFTAILLYKFTDNNAVRVVITSALIAVSIGLDVVIVTDYIIANLRGK